ncbi:hypothetical protein DID78_05050, partial [Candidatus Marinamargulisbacteria bacterium SCGC AG-343-D04]
MIMGNELSSSLKNTKVMNPRRIDIRRASVAAKALNEDRNTKARLPYLFSYEPVPATREEVLRSKEALKSLSGPSPSIESK